MIKLFYILPVLAFSPSCATVFSGTTQKIYIETIPPKSTVIILGGSLGSMTAKMKGSSDIVAFILSFLSPFASKEEVEFIKSIRFETFVTHLVVDVQKEMDLPKDSSTSQKLAEIFAKIPEPVKRTFIHKFGFETLAVSPFSLELSRGDTYAIIGYKRSKEIQMEVVEGTFNWVTLLNVFNFGLGLLVDIPTGAWQTLDPEQVLVKLETRGTVMSGLQPLK